MREDYFTIRIPRFDGRKTLTFNLAVLAFAAYAATCAALGSTVWQPVSIETAGALAGVALVNVVLRAVTSRPVLSERLPAVGEYGLAASPYPRATASEHAARNTANAHNIAQHLEHLKASELPMDFEEEKVMNGQAYRGK